MNQYLGINYGGGHIIKYIKNSPLLLGYTNVLIAVDDIESKFIFSSTLQIINDIFVKCCKIIDSTGYVVIQVETYQMWFDTIKPYLLELWTSERKFDEVVYVNIGITQSCYPDYRAIDKPFVFINIGTFVSIGNNIVSGTVCVPLFIYDVSSYNGKYLYVSNKNVYEYDIGLALDIPKIKLLAMDDSITLLNQYVGSFDELMYLF